jgi:hypothetical protein
MIRTILKSDKNSLTLELPNDMVGKLIEIIAFEVDKAEAPKKVEEVEKSEKIAALNKALNKYRVNLSDFKFDRDEANDYD